MKIRLIKTSWFHQAARDAQDSAKTLRTEVRKRWMLSGLLFRAPPAAPKSPSSTSPPDNLPFDLKKEVRIRRPKQAGFCRFQAQVYTAEILTKLKVLNSSPLAVMR